MEVTSVPGSKPVVALTREETNEVYALALERLHDPSRQHSPTRHNARSIDAQYRGALGEYAASKWIQGFRLQLNSGFLDDRPSNSDLSIAGFGIEVMTALVEHRRRYGYCVPPAKLRAARNRGSRGYLFVSVESRSARDVAIIDWYCDIDDVSRNPYVTQDNGIDNFVCPPECLQHPQSLLSLLGVADAS